jgi:hypothetical protein
VTCYVNVDIGSAIPWIKPSVLKLTFSLNTGRALNDGFIDSISVRGKPFWNICQSGRSFRAGILFRL